MELEPTDFRNSSLSVLGCTFENPGPAPMPLQIVFKRTSRKARQKFLADKARELGTTIREVKKLYGNGSSLTVPGCRITRNSGGLLEFDGDGMAVSFTLRETHIPEFGKV